MKKNWIQLEFMKLFLAKETYINSTPEVSKNNTMYSCSALSFYIESNYKILDNDELCKFIR